MAPCEKCNSAEFPSNPQRTHHIDWFTLKGHSLYTHQRSFYLQRFSPDDHLFSYWESHFGCADVSMCRTPDRARVASVEFNCLQREPLGSHPLKSYLHHLKEGLTPLHALSAIPSSTPISTRILTLKVRKMIRHFFKADMELIRGDWTGFFECRLLAVRVVRNFKEPTANQIFFSPLLLQLYQE